MENQDKSQMKTETNKNVETSKELNINKTREEDSSYFDLRTKRGQILFFLITVSIPLLFQLMPNNIFVNVRDTNAIVNAACNHVPPPIIQEVEVEKLPTYWVYSRSGDHLKHVHLVLNRLGLREGSNQSDWDLLWAHDYPFGKLQNMMLNLKSHQKVNHFPGCGYITNKVDLATTNMKYVPRSFKLPEQKEDLLQYAAENPDKLFVQKNNQHRNIQIKKLSEIDFTNNETFIQEFVDKPLLVDGHKFDIGVYTIITSIDPLRVYIYNGDILLRYCLVKYYPFDAHDIDKYIVGDDYLPSWEVPSLSQYYNGLGFGMRGSFDAYMRNKGRDPTIMWDRIEDAIRVAITEKETHIAKILDSKYRNKKRNFFEMIRFDLIADDDFNVYLMEANMSPNLSSAHYPPNQLLYEQVMYNMLSLVGVGSLLHRQSFRKASHTTEIMLSTDKNIAVNGEICSAAPCTESCAPEACRLCRPCLSQSDLAIIHEAYREHVRRIETKRIIPKPIRDRNAPVDENELADMSPQNKFMAKWFFAKCKLDEYWCT